MPRGLVSIRIEVDQETDLCLRRWAAEKGRSKRRHVAIVARRLARKWDERRRQLPARD
jgi:hypothetical protein